MHVLSLPVEMEQPAAPPRRPGTSPAPAPRGSPETGATLTSKIVLILHVQSTKFVLMESTSSVASVRTVREIHFGCVIKPLLNLKFMKFHFDLIERLQRVIRV